MSFADALEFLVAVREQTSRATDNEQAAFLYHCLTNVAPSRSQFLQDLWVAFELKFRKNGFFVEFGGADGIKYSNSYYLETELGWNGIVAEPARIYYPAIYTNRNCFIDRRCVWVESGGSITFNQTPIAAHSTIDAFSGSDMHAATREKGDRYDVETVSLADLLRYWNAPRRIDYLSIDTEGSELDILKSFDFTAYDIRLITVEHNYSDQRGPIFDLLTSKGYHRKFEKLSNVDDWYVKAY
ncbi:MAG: FkbM family methyltransferase [Phenylobacterium sp.]